MVKFGGKIGTLYQMLKNAFKKDPLQNRTNVQIKGGVGQRPFEQCSKKLHFFETMASLSHKHARFVGRYTAVVFSYMYLSLSLIEHVIQITTHGQVKTSTCIPILLTRMMLINLKSFPEILN